MSHSSAPVPGASPCPTVDDVVLPSFGVLVALELQFIRTQHAKFDGIHDAIPLIAYYMSELQEFRMMPIAKRDPVRMLHQLARLAAQVEKAAEDLGLVNDHGEKLEALLYSRFETRK